MSSTTSLMAPPARCLDRRDGRAGIIGSFAFRRTTMCNSDGGLAHGQRTRSNRLAACRAGCLRVELFAATVLPDERQRIVHQIVVAPLLERHDHRPQVPAGLGQAVLVPDRPLRVLMTFQDTELFESPQPRSKDVAWRTGVCRDVVEPSYA